MRRPFALTRPAFAAWALVLATGAEAVESEGAPDEPGASVPAPQVSPPQTPAESTAATPDIAGLKRDTLYFLGYELVAVAVLYSLPQDTTHFDRASGSYGKWRENVTHPSWDKDDLYVNYVLHPYWGAAYYVRGRERRLDRMQAFGYSALLSTIYEFGAEALFEPVSYQDLVVTPVVGSLLGEYLFMPVRENILAKSKLSVLDKVALVLTDPLGALNGLTDRLFGVPTQVSFGPVGAHPAWASRLRANAHPALPPALATEHGSAALRPGGASVPGKTWGVRLELRW